MNAAEAFGQYLELWRANAASLKRGPVAARLNAEAAGRLPEAIGAYRPDLQDLPQCRPEAVFAPDYGINLTALPMTADVAASFHCGVPQLNSLLCVVANDSCHVPAPAAMPAGLEIYTLAALPEQYHADASALLTGGDDELPALVNSLLLADGIYIRVAPGARIDKPVQIVNIFNSTVPMLTPRRVVVHACAGAHVKVLLCDHSQTPAVAHLNSQTVRVCAEEGARVELYDIEESSDATNRYWQLFATQHRDSSLTVCTAFLHGGLTHNDYFVDVVGDNASTWLGGFAICSAKQVADNRVTLRHKATHCQSRQLFKNALFGESTGAFGGKIIVEEGAMATDAVQTNRNLLASDTARMVTAPQLEIYCDDVKCGHGATTGQLDERALFYMQTRGIPRDEATMMLTQAFMADVVDSISFEVLRQRLHMLVEKRLNGTSGGCDTCASACKVQNNNKEGL